jgi:hypothetical protein
MATSVKSLAVLSELGYNALQSRRFISLKPTHQTMIDLAARTAPKK